MMAQGERVARKTIFPLVGYSIAILKGLGDGDSPTALTNHRSGRRTSSERPQKGRWYQRQFRAPRRAGGLLQMQARHYSDRSDRSDRSVGVGSDFRCPGLHVGRWVRWWERRRGEWMALGCLRLDRERGWQMWQMWEMKRGGRIAANAGASWVGRESSSRQSRRRWLLSVRSQRWARASAAAGGSWAIRGSHSYAKRDIRRKVASSSTGHRAARIAWAPAWSRAVVRPLTSSVGSRRCAFALWQAESATRRRPWRLMSPIRISASVNGRRLARHNPERNGASGR
jgi:hypothetical protein